MNRFLKVIAVYAALALILWPAFQLDEDPAQPALPPLPAEAQLVYPSSARDFCGSDFLRHSLESRSFRWLTRGEPIWKHRLTLSCDEPDERTVSISVGTARLTYARPGGFDGDNTTAEVIARLLPLDARVREAAVAAYLANQADVARAGADLWRAGRWKEAADALSAALENDWDDAEQAQLYFGLADAEAHLGRPRQAYWYALAYVGLSSKPLSESWLKSLRGAAGLAAGSQGVEPQAQALLRQWRREAGEKRWDLALRTLQSLCRAAPWADSYQDAVAQVYDELGWKPLAESWRRRAALTRRLAADQALQAKTAALLR